ncbi:MAG: WD40 repeat domain-containing protein, partial [Anaerolineae bacterium]|nr:WD40 repeat domain-containing protein [Anaerolineae bacterium]
MKDDFLHEFREAPRADFTEALYQQLLEEENNTVSSLSVPLHAINGHHSRQHSPVKTRSLAWIAAILALMLFGSLLVYMVSSGVPHPVTLTQIQTEISLSDLPLITRENVGQLTVVRQMGSGRVTEIAWSPDGNTLAVAGTFGVWLYDTHAWDAPPLLLPLSSDGAERHLAFSPDGTLLASTDDLLIRLWNTDTWSLVATLEGHTNSITRLAFSPDSTLLASGGGDFGVENPDYAIRLWDVQSGEVKTTITSPKGITRSLAFSPDGSLLAGTCWCDGDNEWVLNIQTGQEAGYLVHDAHTKYHPGMVFSPDGTLLAEATSQGINLWNVANGQQVAQAKRTGSSPLGLRGMTFSPDGSLLAFGGSDDGINLWDTGTQEFLPRSFEQLMLINVESLTFSPDGTQIATLN